MSRTVFTERAVQVIDPVEGVIRGYVAIWGNPEHKDAYDTYWDRSRPPEMAIDNGMHRRPILYEHTQDGIVRTEIVGVIDRVWFDDIGIPYEGHLDRSARYFDRMVAELLAGELKTSSATMEHTAEFYEDGAFRTWILGELSLTKTPAEPRMPATVLVRSDTPPVPTDTRTEDAMSNPIIQEAPPQRDATAMLQQMLDAEYTLEEIQAALDALKNGGDPAAMSLPEEARSLIPQLRAALEGRITAQRRDQRDTERDNRIKALEEALTAQRNAAPPDDGTRFVRGNGRGTHISVGSKYDHLSYSDMGFVYEAMRNQSSRVSPEFVKAMAIKTAMAAEKGDAAAGHYAVRSAFPFKYLRADEIMASDIASQGDEWVGIQYSTTLWEKIRVSRIYEGLLSRGMMELEVPQGMESVYVPTEGADPTWYTTAQADDIDATGRPEVTVRTSTVGTGRQQLTPGELSAAVMYNGIMEEDSLIAMAPQLNRQMQESGEEAVEYVIINGDTTTTASTNINLIDSTPGSGLSAPRYLVTNGLLKLPLVTTTANSRDGGALDEDDYLSTVSLLPDELAANFDNLLFITDVRTNIASKKIVAVKTKDVSSAATIDNGKLTSIWGIEIAVSGQMGLANTAGKVSATGSNNTKGRILCAAPRYWAVAYKRRMEIKSGEDILSNTKFIVARLRIGVQYRTATASSVSYNLTV